MLPRLADREIGWTPDQSRPAGLPAERRRPARGPKAGHGAHV